MCILEQYIYLNGKKLDVKEATTAENAKTKIMNERLRKLFVGNLHDKVNEEALKVRLSEFGEIQKIIVVYDHDTKKSRGFGFVVFATEQDANKVLKKKSLFLHGKRMKFKKVLLRNEVNLHK